MQIDINKAGEGLREHRTANRPTWVVTNKMTENDRAKLASPRPAHTALLIEGLQDGDDIKKHIQPLPTAVIDEKLYSPQPAMQAMMQATGIQAADLGQQRPDERATGQQISAQQKASTDGSNIDDVDFALTTEAQMIWEMCIQETPSATVKKWVGDGAIWPDVPAQRLDMMNEIFLQIEAGSSGKPNQAIEVQNFQLIAPQLAQLMQAEGKSLEPLIREGVRRLGDKLDVDEFLKSSPFAQQQASAQQPPPPPPNQPKISFDGNKLAPDERAQALAQDGIKATPGYVPPQPVSAAKPTAASPHQPVKPNTK
jgi:hypothetical protein